MPACRKMSVRGTFVDGAAAFPTAFWGTTDVELNAVDRLYLTRTGHALQVPVAMQDTRGPISQTGQADGRRLSRRCSPPSDFQRRTWWQGARIRRKAPG